MNLIELRQENSEKLLLDAKEILESQYSYLEDSKERIDALSFLKTAVSEHNPARIFLFQKSNGESVGLALVNLAWGYETGGSYLWVNELIIHKKHRKKGYGKLFSAGILEWCKKNKIKALYAVTSSINDASQRMMLQSGLNLRSTTWCEKIF